MLVLESQLFEHTSMGIKTTGDLWSGKRAFVSNKTDTVWYPIMYNRAHSAAR